MSKLELSGRNIADADKVLTPDALAFVTRLVEAFAPRVDALLARRRETQARYDAGSTPDFLAETKSVRDGDWRVAPLPADLQRRVVEITGPVDRKMIINALNSGADVFMADFEDSNAPTWANCVEGQKNLMDAVRRTISLDTSGKSYRLHEKIATLLVRPRGWHLPEAHLRREGKPVPAALVDFGLYFFHNARALLERGTGPYFYLPKMQSHLEARLWNDVFVAAQRALDLPLGTIKATVLIETLPAAFEMDEILYELRDHAAGLNCGRWDYIFSFIKTFRNHASFLLPDRAEVTMTQPFMRAYTQLLVKTCHRRGAFAMGGMAAQIPIKNDTAANETALAKVRADKEREANGGHDGTWVAHPGLVAIARDAFELVMHGAPNQLGKLREDVEVSARDLIAVPNGKRTDAGLRQNIRVGIQYLEAWLGGQGCVPLYNLMEDAATAEISRTQIWQQLRHRAQTDDGAPITTDRVERTVAEELDGIRREVGDARFENGRFEQARALFTRIATDTSSFTEFLTLPAYQQLSDA
jgi:malate synthase